MLVSYACILYLYSMLVSYACVLDELVGNFISPIDQVQL